MSTQPPRIGGGLFSKSRQEGRKANADGDGKPQEGDMGKVTAPVSLPTAPSRQAVGTAESLFSPTGSSSLPGIFGATSSNGSQTTNSDSNTTEGKSAEQAGTGQSPSSPPPPPPPEVGASDRTGSDEKSSVHSEGAERNPSLERPVSTAAESVLVALRSVVDSGGESAKEKGGNNAAGEGQTEAADVALAEGEPPSGPPRYVSSHRTPKAISANSNPFGAVASRAGERTARAGVTSPRYVKPFPPGMHADSGDDGSKDGQRGTEAEGQEPMAAPPQSGSRSVHSSQRHVPEPVKASSDPFGSVPRPRTESGSLGSPGVTSPRYVNPFPEAMHKPLGSPRSGVVMPPSFHQEADFPPRQALDAKALFSEDDWTSFIPPGGDRSGQEEVEAAAEHSVMHWSDGDAATQPDAAATAPSQQPDGQTGRSSAAETSPEGVDGDAAATTTEAEEKMPTSTASPTAEEQAPAAATVPAKAEEKAPAAATVPAKAEEKAPGSTLPPKAEEKAPAAATVPPRVDEKAPAAASVPPRAEEQAPAAASVPVGSPGVPTAASLFEDSMSPVDFISGTRPPALSFSALLHSQEAQQQQQQQQPEVPVTTEKEKGRTTPPPVIPEKPQGKERARRSTDDLPVPGVAFGFGGEVFEVSGGRVSSVPFPREVAEELRSYPGPFTPSTPKAVVQQYCERMVAGTNGDERILWELLAVLAREDTNPTNWQEKVRGALLEGSTIGNGVDSLVRLCCAAAADDAKLDTFVKSETEDVDWACVLALASTQGPDSFRHFMALYGERGIATTHRDVRESPARLILQLVVETFTGEGTTDEMGAESLDLWAVAAVLFLRMAAFDRAAVGLRRLADSLMHAGRVPAADVCYILGKMISGPKQLFDPVDDPNALMCMLLVDHRDISQLSRILQPRALHASEVLEYVGPAAVEPSLVPFKFVYAQRLAECGLLDQASAYCKEIYQYMGDQPAGRYSKHLRNLVGDFGRRLTLHRRYVPEAELCTSDYKLDESDNKRGLWGGLKSLAAGSRQTTPESTWAKPQPAPSSAAQPAPPSAPQMAPAQHHQRPAATVPPPVQVPSTAEPPAMVTQQQQPPTAPMPVGAMQGPRIDTEANPFAHPQPAAAPPHQQQQHTASRGQWSDGPHVTATGIARPHPREGALPGSGSLVSPVASHATPIGFHPESMATAPPSSGQSMQVGGPSSPPLPHRQGSIASPHPLQGVSSPSSGRAHRLPSAAFSNAGMASPPPPVPGQQPGFFDGQQQQYGYADSMPPPGGRPPLIPPNQQWGSRPRVQTTERASNDQNHPDALESAGKYLGGLLGGLKSAVAGISESLSGSSQPEGDPYALGEENTFYYDEVRKEWRQRGQPEGQVSPVAAAPPAPAAPLAPPPTGFAPTQRKQYTQGNYVDVMRFG
ncbi:Protein transport protein Sec16B [Perkinsus olseni]|uniref:Protein transport protein Sec16B n=1 Tax=Perkinsus olseni TaxID=32597 RepID=A0A7J6MT55_PEROL|nr:Protein transport protein Sec16B [Perkinsus olseni]